jgi:RNA polymerase sigma factor (sigma-70 family)
MNPGGHGEGGRPGGTLAAIEGIYRSQLPEFRRAAAAITGDRELACDAVQDAFVRAVRRQAAFRGEGSLDGWIWRIVINTTLSQARAHRPTGPLAGDPSTSDNGHTDAATDRVRSALRELPDRQRLILFLTTPTSTTPRSPKRSASAPAPSASPCTERGQACADGSRSPHERTRPTRRPG